MVNVNHDEKADRHDGRCGNCNQPTYKMHCKVMCPQCGVLVDCSDPFRPV